VQGSARHHAAVGAELAAQPLGDLVGGFVGEGERENPVGRDAMPGDVMADAPDQAEGLPGSWSRDDENRTPLGGNRRPLLVGGSCALS